MKQCELAREMMLKPQGNEQVRHCPHLCSLRGKEGGMETAEKHQQNIYLIQVKDGASKPTETHRMI